MCKPLFLSRPHFPLPTFVSCFFILQRLQGRVSLPHVCPGLSTMADLSSPKYLEETLRTGPCTHFLVAKPMFWSPLICSVTVGLICAVVNMCWAPCACRSWQSTDPCYSPLLSQALLMLSPFPVRWPNLIFWERRNAGSLQWQHRRFRNVLKHTQFSTHLIKLDEESWAKSESNVFLSISLHVPIRHKKTVGPIEHYTLHLHGWHVKVWDISVLRGQPRKIRHQRSLGSAHIQIQRQTQLGVQTVPCPGITEIVFPLAAK